MDACCTRIQMKRAEKIMGNKGLLDFSGGGYFGVIRYDISPNLSCRLRGETSRRVSSRPFIIQGICCETHQ